MYTKALTLTCASYYDINLPDDFIQLYHPEPIHAGRKGRHAMSKSKEAVGQKLVTK